MPIHPLDWNDDLATGDAGFDAAHREFIDCVNAMVHAQDDELPAALRAFQGHAEAHFAAEDRMMMTQPYPSAGCHLDEHRAVLASVAEVMPLLAAGNHGIVRALAGELVRWFPEHTEEMDKSFVRWLVQRQTGAVPLAFRKRRDMPLL